MFGVLSLIDISLMATEATAAAGVATADIVAAVETAVAVVTKVDRRGLPCRRCAKFVLKSADWGYT